MTDSTNKLQHIAIIMDGNGRWAKKRGLPRSVGHKKGAEVVKEITRAAGELGVKYLTLYAFFHRKLAAGPGRSRNSDGAVA